MSALALLSGLFVVGCEWRSAEKSSAPTTGESSIQGSAPTATIKPTTASSGNVVDTFAKDRELDQTPIGQEWIAIWTLSDPFPALKKFVDRHGLFLETAEKVGEISVFTSEGPCGDDFTSLVKDTSKAIEHAWEIDEKGKILRRWQLGSPDIVRVDGHRLIRTIELLRKPSDYNLSNPRRDSTYTTFLLAIGDDGKFEILSEEAEDAASWAVREIPCPAGLNIESDYKYCVKEKKSGRVFVLQRECT